MFWICETVVMICNLNASFEIFLLLFAIRMNRMLGPNPKPCSRFCVRVRRKSEDNVGCRELKSEFVIWRWLLNDTFIVVPVLKPWK